MRFGRGDFKNLEQAEERCFLLTNGLGGYCSLTLAGGNARKDHALFMGVEKAPNCRYHYLTNLQESLETEKEVFDLSTQRYVNWTKNQHGYRYLQMVSPEDIPEWVFEARGITVRREIVMVHEENTVGIRYRITAPEGTKAVLKVCPLLRCSKKDEEPKESQSYLLGEKTLESDGKRLYYETDGTVVPLKEERISDLYFAYDSRDGREAVGMVVKNHEIRFAVSGGTREYSLIYSDRPVEKTVRELMEAERLRLLKLTETAGFQDPAAVRLVKSADQFLVKRESTGGDSIMAGYPFFSDWGRDTMIAVLGCGIETRQFERVKSILRTFAFYCEKGLMPNLFPEGESEPLYNTVDASLWFVEAVYEYGKASGDLDFVKEMLPNLESVVNWYRKGTDFHIFMDEDGLISAGAGLEQVTWMDVRYEDILPTSRHGKPVEVNALWYNALCILAELSENGHEYETLAETVKQSFLE